MSNKGTNHVIALPTSGGALAGLGETFAPDLHTGTGQFSVPLQLPDGRNGFQPQLQLSYSTGAGNGPFGLGWDLGIPGIQRKTTSGIPQYRDRATDPAAWDTFILSSAEDLVPLGASTDGRTRYRPCTEGLFARIVRHHDAANDYWELRSKDGLIHYYGTPASAGADPTVVADPVDPRKVFSWHLTRTVDPLGNRIDYSYERDTGAADAHRWAQRYLTQMRYVDYRDDTTGDSRSATSQSPRPTCHSDQSTWRRLV